MPRQTLPVAAPATVLAVGAYLKNTACLLDGGNLCWSAPHGDLSTPQACAALEESLEMLVAQARMPVQAVAHDLHPDFHSTRLAVQWAERLGVPAFGVQHHHAHLAVVQAEQGLREDAIVGLALDGVGLGTDGQAWGGEVLVVRDHHSQRVAHLPPLPLPGGDVAAREPWRLAAAVLHATGQSARIVPWLGPQVGDTFARGVQMLLDKDLNCPRSSAAGRWFDAAAAALGLNLRQTREAEAAQAVEAAAHEWFASHDADELDACDCTLDDLPAFVATLVDEPDRGRGAARFHRSLAQMLSAAVIQACRAQGVRTVALGGGCFFNRILSAAVEVRLRGAGLTVHRPAALSVGDASLALGQAWVAAHHLGESPETQALLATEES
ncbi:MAG: carbamoyltransferase HypF [Rubrivivax sp.]|nr:carbamoyltransferase HypF [Rubrivivax sp.]